MYSSRSQALLYTLKQKDNCYALYGDDLKGGYYGQRWRTGDYTLTATPYSRGNKGKTLAIAFQVVWSTSNAKTALQVYPVPTRGKVYVVHEAEQQQVQLELRDHEGNLLLSKPLSQQKTEEMLDLGSFGKGNYYIKLISREAVETKRVVVE